MKVCSACKLVKPFEMFNVLRKNPDGSPKSWNSWCKPCKAAKRREDRKKNLKPPRKIMTADRKECTNCHKVLPHQSFHATKRNKDGTIKYSASWCKTCQLNAYFEKQGGRKKKKPIVTENGKQCCDCGEIKVKDQFSPSQRGRLGLSAYCKPCFSKRVRESEGFKERNAASARKYREENRYTWRAAHRIHQFNRRSAIKATEDGTATPAFVQSVYEREECYWCKQYVEPKKRTLEHIKELSEGGKHSADNITMACASCNSARRGRTK